MAKKKKVAEDLHDGLAPASLTDIERLNVLRLDAEMRAAKAEMMSKQLLLEALIQKLDPQGLLRKQQDEISLAKGEFAKFHSEYLSVIKSIEDRLGVSMKTHSFDPDSGTLHPHPDTE